jgi:Glycosyl transferase 4-like domain
VRPADAAPTAEAIRLPQWRQSRRVCCVSLNFPPSSIASVHRARHLAKYLPIYNWQPIIVCVDERDLHEPLDWQLTDLVPKDITIHKIRGIPRRLIHPLGITDLGLRAYWSLRQKLTILFESNDYDVVFMTGWPFYQMLLSHYIKRRVGIPIVLDFQDPWVSNWGAAQSVFSKAGLSHWLATMLEPRALRCADFVTSVSDVQNGEMAVRYPWLDSSRMAAIPIGGDPDDFNAMRPGSVEAGESDLEPGFVHLSYVGTLLPRARPLISALFRAFAQLRSCDPALAARIRLNFVGTSNQPSDHNSHPARAIAESEGVSEAVWEIPRRLPYLQALRVVVESKGLLLIGSDEPHYTASKIYPALMSGRPYLSLFHRASSAHAILSSAGGGRTLAFETPQELNALEAPIAEALKTLALNPKSLGMADRASYAPYEAGNIVKRFADIFDCVSTHTVRTLQP